MGSTDASRPQCPSAVRDTTANPCKGKCEAVYLAPLGKFSSSAPSINALQRFLEAYLCVPCHILKNCSLECDEAEKNFVFKTDSANERIPITSRLNPHTKNTQLLISDVHRFSSQCYLMWTASRCAQEMQARRRYDSIDVDVLSEFSVFRAGSDDARSLP